MNGLLTERYRKETEERNGQRDSKMEKLESGDPTYTHPDQWIQTSGLCLTWVPDQTDLEKGRLTAGACATCIQSVVLIIGEL